MLSRLLLSSLSLCNQSRTSLETEIPRAITANQKVLSRENILRLLLELLHFGFELLPTQF